MNEEPPGWADWLLTAWVLVVGVFYFGGYFLPAQIGRYTVSASALYALMLLISVGAMAWQYLRPGETNVGDKPQKASPKNRAGSKNGSPKNGNPKNRK